MIIVAVTLAACLAGALAALIAAFTGWLKDRQRLAESRVDATEKAGTIAIRDATITTLTDAVAVEKERANALDDAMDEVAATGDAAGARQRVLRRQRDREAAAGSTNGAGARAVHPESPAEVVPFDREGLIAPGD